MPKKERKPRPLEFRLSLEASERIKERISHGELAILKNISKDESKLIRLGRIADEATRILEKNKQPIEGCSTEEAVDSWLNRERSKELSVFKALCQAVDENWAEVFDRCLYTEILIGEQKRTLENFMISFFGAFVSEPKEQMTILSRYSQFVEQILGSDQADSETVISLIDTFIKDFALNGRQIRFGAKSSSKNCFITSIKVRGENQENEIKVWENSYNSPFPVFVETKDWWWKGSVSIEFEGIHGIHKFNKSCEIFISEKGYIWAEILFDLENDTYTIN